ncbi:MAG: DUF2878 family protein [Deltaproteobacteria bacterium]|nr:DUF2878 family protein [Deltaproteobacteria bacterium]
MNERRHLLLDATAQQLGWWGAVLCAARGLLLPAALFAFAPAALRIALASGERGRVFGLSLAALLFGLSTDSLLVRSDLVHFAGGFAVPPAWMAGLWASFGAGLTSSLARAAAWPPGVLAALAALAGPLAYRGGAAMGALSPFGLGAAAAIAAQWALGVPLLALLARQAPGEGSTRAAPGRP